MSVSCEGCVMSGRDLYDCPITRPEESYRVWCVWVWSWSIGNDEALAHWRAVQPLQKKKKRDYYDLLIIAIKPNVKDDFERPPYFVTIYNKFCKTSFK